MLPKAARLTSKEVEEVLKKGSPVHISLPKGQKSLISARFLRASGGFRAAAAAPKSLVKSAVMRNRLRRAVYGALASLPSPKKSGMAVFFVRGVPKKPMTRAFAAEIALFIEKISA
jgi:RNase P protein component